MKTATRKPTIAFVCRRLVRLERLLKAYGARLAFLEERAVLADRADVGRAVKNRVRSC